MKRPTIVIADDHLVVAEGLRHILERAGYAIAGFARDGRELLEIAAQIQPDLIIADVAMPLLNGIDAASEIHQRHPKIKIIFLTMHSEVPYATAALGTGASGYVLKNAAGEELSAAVREVLKGGTYISKSIAEAVQRAREIQPVNTRNSIELTHRQLEVLQLLAEGKQVKEVAALLNLSPKTIEFHKYRIMDLLGLRTMPELTRYALTRGMLS